MKNRWIYFFLGVVSVHVKGQGIELFLNRCARNGILLWNVKKSESHTSFLIRLKDVHALRRVVRESECKCFFQRGRGLPFLIKRTMRNGGFLLGFIFFIGVIFMLSNMLWNVSIEGADPKTEHNIKKQLDELGIKQGRFLFSLPSEEQIQDHIIDHVEGLTWIGVELVGTSYHLNVVDQEKPEVKDIDGPRHIVAKKDAVISKMFVEKGKPVVEVNQYVKKGETLVSGLYGEDDKKSIVSAKAEILGETIYQTSIETPLESTFQSYTGENMNEYSVSFGSLKVPVWGISDNDFKRYTEESTDHQIKFFRWELPVVIERKTIRESETLKRIYSEDEAIEAAEKLGREYILSEIDKDASIKEEKVLHEEISNGKVKLTILYNVIEDIVDTIPINQGE
ncbi:sporulation protein YqfD [Bacillus carboniphilus]|uniref:Sporulation protein YqfD n=1 Tax=Bacillus carboniphilus TaxID=86663 RepID=A0ABY9JX67_9BACI|nr:sporulation protein YqfD [Bacillus carboniphilus]WLR43986.1 sporulation protein YqfD [Bacillus carboniphilus]